MKLKEVLIDELPFMVIIAFIFIIIILVIVAVIRSESMQHEETLACINSNSTSEVCLSKAYSRH